MTFEEAKQDPDFMEWYNERPSSIQAAIAVLPPTQLYRLKSSGKQCHILSYEEPEPPGIEVTLTVQKTGKGGLMEKLGMAELDSNRVFGVNPGDLEPWLDEPVKPAT